MIGLSANELAQMRADAIELMSDTCSILSVAYTRDGEGGLAEVWGTLTASVACRIDYITGREAQIGGAVQPYARARLTVPYDTTLETTNRILADGRTYSVKSVNSGQSWIVSVRAELEWVA
jgi:head-tail adaptor